jgi:RNA polymerase sigma-70 factor (ECF subfamily)
MKTKLNTISDEKKAAFEKIAFEHMDILYRTALRLTKNTQEAEDLVQDTYLRAYNHFDKFLEGTNFKAWIFKILTNTFINRYRRNKRQPLHLDIDELSFRLEAEFVQEEPQVDVVTNENYQEFFDDRINRALDKLSDDFRQILLLSELEGLSYKEIAKKINIPLGTVMSRLFRGRRMLQRSLTGFARQEGYLAKAVMP